MSPRPLLRGHVATSQQVTEQVHPAVSHWTHEKNGETLRSTTPRSTATDTRVKRRTE